MYTMQLRCRWLSVVTRTEREVTKTWWNEENKQREEKKKLKVNAKKSEGKHRMHKMTQTHATYASLIHFSCTDVVA